MARYDNIGSLLQTGSPNGAANATNWNTPSTYIRVKIKALFSIFDIYHLLTNHEIHPKPQCAPVLYLLKALVV